MSYESTQKITELLELLFNNFLKAFLKTKLGGWFFGKIINIAVDQLSGVLISPLIDVLVINAYKNLDIKRARMMIDALERAKIERDKELYNNSVDDLLGGM